MKRTYVQPMVADAMIGLESMICGSRSITSNYDGFTYGGVDTDGGVDPEARSGHGIWSDGEEQQ